MSLLDSHATTNDQEFRNFSMSARMGFLAGILPCEVIKPIKSFKCSEDTTMVTERETMVDREATKDLPKGKLPDGIGVRVHTRRKQDGTFVSDLKAADAVEDGPIFTNDGKGADGDRHDCWAYMAYVAVNHTDPVTGEKSGCSPMATLKDAKVGIPVEPNIMVGKQPREGQRSKTWHPLNNVYMLYGSYTAGKGGGSAISAGVELDDKKSFEDFKKSFKANK